MQAGEEFWRDRSVPVTGSTGFLGFWLTQVPMRLGARVSGLVRECQARSGLFRDVCAYRISIARGSVEDYGLHERALNEYEAPCFTWRSRRSSASPSNPPCPPLKAISAAPGTCWRLPARPLAQTPRHRIERQGERRPVEAAVPGDHAADGGPPYDVSKSCADLLAHAYHRTYGLAVCVTRCGNIYGGGDLNFSRIIPGTIRSLIRPKPPIIRSDRTYRRDYFCVEDAA